MPIIQIYTDGKGNIIGSEKVSDNTLLGNVSVIGKAYSYGVSGGTSEVNNTLVLLASIRERGGDSATKDAAARLVATRHPYDRVVFVQRPDLVGKLGDSGKVSGKPIIAQFLDP